MTPAVHPANACAWCGNPRGDELRATRHRATHEPARICKDNFACIRRQMQAKIERRTGRAA